MIEPDKNLWLKYASKEEAEVINIQVFPDGNEWCALIGDNLQVGLSGHGSTIAIALINLIKDIACNAMSEDKADD